MKEQFPKDTYVVYGKMGVCRVADRRMMSFGADAQEYYVLCPQSDPRSSVYVPCQNEQLMARLQALLSKEEIDSLLSEQEIDWIEDKNARASYFRGVLNQGDRRRLLQLIRCLYARKQEKIAEGKKLAAADEVTLQECVRQVEEEFSLVLQIPRNQVGEYIRRQAGADEE